MLKGKVSAHAIPPVARSPLLGALSARAALQGDPGGHTILWSLGIASVSAVVGLLLVRLPAAGFLLAVTIIAVPALASPAGLWAVCALVGALTFRAFVTLGWLPSVATYLDIPLAFGALSAALLRTRAVPRSARAPLMCLLILAMATFTSWAIHPTEAIRPVLYLALIAEPFALLCALLVDPPTARVRRVLIVTALALVAVQVPLAFMQAVSVSAVRVGLGDPIQGTLYGAGAGAHTMSAVVALGAAWVLSSDRSWLERIVLAMPLMAIPLMADAKQVIFAAPIAAVLSTRRWSRGNAIRILAAVAAAGFLLLYLPAGQTAIRFLDGARTGQGGKERVASIVGGAITSDAASFLLGRGPAETVSRAAFMTTDLFLQADSPLRSLHLHPALIALEAQEKAISASGGGTSFNSGVSSALGILGDLGIIGAVAYALLFLSVVVPLKRQRTSDAQVALFGWMLFGLLGVIFDWWEQPAFSVLIAVMSGLALTSSSVRQPGPSPLTGGLPD